MNDAPKEQVLVTNKHPFYREKGQRCPNCGSTEEELFVVGDTILLWCQGCESAKGKDAFRKWNIEKPEASILDRCPYCGNDVESTNEQGQTICPKCKKLNPLHEPCSKCGSENGGLSRAGKTLKIICLDCGKVKKTIHNAK